MQLHEYFIIVKLYMLAAVLSVVQDNLYKESMAEHQSTIWYSRPNGKSIV